MQFDDGFYAEFRGLRERFEVFARFRRIVHRQRDQATLRGAQLVELCKRRAHA